MLWLREKESNLHLRVQSPTCCQLHHPEKHCRLPIVDCRFEDLRRSGSCQSAIGNQQSAMIMVAVEGIEPTSLDYRSSALAIELHREKQG
jgi:hypothetical protein